MNYIYPVAVLGSLGFIFAVLLSIASKVFAVEIDEKELAVLNALPGANCGACGYPGCSGLAKAIAEGKAPVTACSVGGEASANAISLIMGVDGGEVEKEVAVVLCQGDCNKSEDKYEFQGIQDCRTESYVQGGSKACSYGCLGCGTCKDVCEFDAIKIEDGIAVIDKEKCVACGRCLEACPKNLIEFVSYNQKYLVKCKSQEKGKSVRETCSIGCIGCQLCVKSCPKDAIEFKDNLAKIDFDKCISCSICAGKCPTKAIYPGMTIKEEKELKAKNQED